MKIEFGNLRIPAVTLVPGEFIDRYMPSANGEYVKVYLYLLRHAEEDVTAAGIADALDLTEGDVRRALSRWERDGLIRTGENELPARTAAAGAAEENLRRAAEPEETRLQTGLRQPSGAEQEISAAQGQEERTSLRDTGKPAERREAAEQKEPERSMAEIPAAAPLKTEAAEPVRELPDKSSVDFLKLKSDETFTDLLYIIQRYLSKIFSQTDSETVAYLYDVLGMPAELLEYLAERCAQNGKTSLRYFEKIAIDWFRKGIRTVDQAKENGNRYPAEVYAVMKTFGLNSREPGTEELKMIRKWYDEYGFTKEIVETACSRTLMRIQKPSFPYTDKILTEWHEAGIRTVSDAERFEEKRAEQKGKNAAGQKTAPVQGSTKFNNFEQRTDDINALGMQIMKQKLGRRSG